MCLNQLVLVEMGYPPYEENVVTSDESFVKRVEEKRKMMTDAEIIYEFKNTMRRIVIAFQSDTKG